VREPAPAPARSGRGWLRTALCGALAVALAFAALPAEAAKDRPRWDTRVLALVGKPGFPARAYVAPNGRIYEGTYENPTGGHEPSRVREYSGAGALLHSWSVPGQNLSGGQGVQVATSDARGRLVLLDRDPARVLILDPQKRVHKFRTYARFPDLAPCLPGTTGPSCSPTLTDDPPVPNYAAWGPGGALYVTDYLQAVIWKVPPGGGTPKVWLADPKLDGNQFGTTGIVLERNHHTLLVMQQASTAGGDGNPSTGKLYSVRIRADHKPGALQRVWESKPVDGPDGFWIARSGRIYAALAGSNQIAVIGRDGSDLGRFPSTPQTGGNGSQVPFDTPSSVMFKGTRLIVANQSFFAGDAANQAILDVEAGERGMPEFIPRRAGLPPRRDQPG
jgi:sugar lactone lactonase YvrE